MKRQIRAFVLLMAFMGTTLMAGPVGHYGHYGSKDNPWIVHGSSETDYTYLSGWKRYAFCSKVKKTVSGRFVCEETLRFKKFPSEEGAVAILSFYSDNHGHLSTENYFSFLFGGSGGCAGQRNEEMNRWFLCYLAIHDPTIKDKFLAGNRWSGQYAKSFPSCSEWKYEEWDKDRQEQLDLCFVATVSGNEWRKVVIHNTLNKWSENSKYPPNKITGFVDVSRIYKGGVFSRIEVISEFNPDKMVIHFPDLGIALVLSD